MGKGSNPRPFSVDKKTFDENFDRIFRKKNEEKSKKSKKTDSR